MKAHRRLNVRSQLAPKPVPVGDVQALRLFERAEQLCGLCGVVPITSQSGHELALPGDVLLAACSMPFGQREMFLEHFPIHSDFLAQAFRAQP